MDKKKVFEQELNKIRSTRIKEVATQLVEELPDYFFEVPASSTGKYHPAYAAGDGGLLRHTKAAVRIAYEFFQDYAFSSKYTSDEQDLILLALMIHDGFKYGREKGKYTCFDHSLIMTDYLEEGKDTLDLSEEEFTLLKNMIASHNGPRPWNAVSYSDIVLPEPHTKYENFVHMCDYLASRKFLQVPFDKENNIID